MANSQDVSVNTDLDDKCYYSDLEDRDPEEKYGSDFVSKTSKQLPENQSSHPVDDMEYEDVVKLMQYLNIKSMESGPRDRSLLKNYLYKRTASYEDKMQDTVNKTMKKYIAGKKKLITTHLEIQELARTNSFQQELGPILEEMFPKYIEQLQERITKLKTDEIEICIIGWTCVGKSTFFNILLGEDIMPTNVLPDTPCLVRLHNSQTGKIQFVSEDKTLRTVELTDDPGEAKRELESILGNWCGCDQTMSAVDLYWPIPRLHENVVFVDTPGIGDNNFLIQQVMTHVPNAAGYIFIINSVDGGGILEGGIVQLFTAIANRDNETEKNLGNVLFICNKWDLIKKHERETVWNDTREKLKQHFGIFKDWQIISFSASVELQIMQLRASPSDDFVKILVGLEKLMSRTIEKHFLDFSGWINNLMQKSVSIIEKELALLELTNAQIIESKKKTEENLKAAEESLERTLGEMEKMIGEKKAEIIKDLQEFLKRPDVQGKVLEWQKHAPSFGRLKADGPKLVAERIHQQISDWAEREEGMLKKELAYLNKKCGQLADDMHKMEIDCRPNRKAEISLNHLIISEFFVGLIKNEAVWIGSLMNYLSNTVVGPCALSGILLVSTLDSRAKHIMVRLASDAISKVSDDKAEDLISIIFELPFKEWIKDFRSDMKTEIASMQIGVSDLRKDSQNKTDLLSTLKSILHKLNICLMHLKKIGVEYYSNDSVSCEYLCIESSSISTTEMFHLHDVVKLDQDKSLTLRVIHGNYTVFYSHEIQKLREMKHINFMTPEGVVYSTSTTEEKTCGCSADSLKLLTQKCIGDLEYYVFNNQSVQGFYSGDPCESFFKMMTRGIANGLSYVHEMGFVHGHLQLSSILLDDDMTPKLCDINILPSLEERNHKRCIFHTSS